MKRKSMIIDKWRRLKLVLPLLIGLFSLMLATTAQAAVITNTDSPIDITVFVPCAAGGAGEVVALSGNLHNQFAITFDNSGGFHAEFHANPQGVSGTGQTTGDKYQGTGVTRANFNGMVGFETSFVNNFRIIGQGSGNNLLIHDNTHVTVHPDGTVTGFVDNFSAECN